MISGDSLADCGLAQKQNQNRTAKHQQHDQQQPEEQQSQSHTADYKRKQRGNQHPVKPVA